MKVKCKFYTVTIKNKISSGKKCAHPMKGKKPSSPTPSARLAAGKWWIGWFLRSLPAQPSSWPLQSPARALVYSTSSFKPGRFAPASSLEFIYFILPPLHHFRVFVPYCFQSCLREMGLFIFCDLWSWTRRPGSSCYLGEMVEMARLFVIAELLCLCQS